MKILEEKCDVITNMEVMLLLVQQQQLLPSVDSLLLCASKPTSAPSGSTTGAGRSKSDPEEGASSYTDSASERFRLDHVKDLLYQHMFNQMVQDYIRKTCPFLHLVRSPSEYTSADRIRTLQMTRNSTRRTVGSSTGSRRSSAVSAIRQGGTSPHISRRCRECLDALVQRFGLTDLELLTIMNLGAFKLVEIYVFLEDCSSRYLQLRSELSKLHWNMFSEDDAASMLNVIDVALMQQQAVPAHSEPAGSTAMDVELKAASQNVKSAPQSELEALQQQQQELQEEARRLELRQQEVQAADLPRNDLPSNTSGHDECAKNVLASGIPPKCSTIDLFAAPGEVAQPAAETYPRPDSSRGSKPRGRPGRTATAKRRAPSRRKRVLDD